MEQIKQRIEWVDIGKFICIMFVMLSHLESGSALLGNFYRPFFLTVFFFLSGYVYRPTASFKEHMVKKVKGLFVPWLIFSNFNILLSMLMTFKDDRNFASEFLWNFLQIRGHGDGVWFVAALFAAFIPFYFIIKWNRPGRAMGLSFLLSLASVIYTRLLPANAFPWGDAALPWHLEYIFQAMFWMVLGYYFKNAMLKSGVVIEKAFDGFNTALHRVVIWVGYLVVAFTPVEIGGVYAYRTSEAYLE